MDENHFSILIIKIKNEVQRNYCIICLGQELIVTVENIH
jgi:hypothetical protein